MTSLDAPKASHEKAPNRTTEPGHCLDRDVVEKLLCRTCMIWDRDGVADISDSNWKKYVLHATASALDARTTGKARRSLTLPMCNCVVHERRQHQEEIAVRR